MANRASKVVVYFAYLSAAAIICTGGHACVVAGSQIAMRQLVEELHPGSGDRVTIKKTRFGEIRRGLELGAAYAFDEEAYGRFYPLGCQEGLSLEWGDFVSQLEKGNRFVTVKFQASA